MGVESQDFWKCGVGHIRTSLGALGPFLGVAPAEPTSASPADSMLKQVVAAFSHRQLMGGEFSIGGMWIFRLALTTGRQN
jgi:hypothetical protein